MKWRILCVVLSAAWASACAGYRVQRDGEGPGYDVYAPEPYLLGTPRVVEANGAKAIAYDFQVLWLPNYSKRYRISSWAGLGKASFTFEFSNGWQLTKIDDQADNTAVLQEVVGLVKHILPPDPFSIAKPGRTTAGPDVQASLNRPVLYRFDYDASGRVSCLRALQPEEMPCSLPCAVPGTRPVPAAGPSK